MNKKYNAMIIELILFYWIGLQPSEKTDKYIDQYTKDMNLTPKSLVETNRENKKENYGNL